MNTVKEQKDKKIVEMLLYPTTTDDNGAFMPAIMVGPTCYVAQGFVNANEDAMAKQSNKDYEALMRAVARMLLEAGYRPR